MIANDDLAGLITGITKPVQGAIDDLARGTAELAGVRRPHSADRGLSGERAASQSLRHQSVRR